MFLGAFFLLEIVSVFISFSISCFFHESRRSISEVDGNAQVSEIFHIVMHGLHRSIDTIVPRETGEVVSSIEHREFALGHPHLLADIVGRIREDHRLCVVDIFRSEIDHPPRDIAGIFTSCEHTTYPVDRGISIRVTEGLMHRGYEIVVLFSILVVVERLTSCGEDIFSCEFTRSLEDTGSLEEVHGISEVAVSEFGDEFEWVFLCPSFWFLSSRGTKRSSRFCFRKLDCHVVRHWNRLTPRNDDTGIPFCYFPYILLEKLYDFPFSYRLEDIGPTARKEGIDDSETRILRRRTDKGDYPFLDPGQEDILLRFRPAVDLIEEEDGLSTRLEVRLRLRDDLHDIFFLREDAREMEKLGIE